VSLADEFELLVQFSSEDKWASSKISSAFQAPSDKTYIWIQPQTSADANHNIAKHKHLATLEEVFCMFFVFSLLVNV